MKYAGRTPSTEAQERALVDFLRERMLIKLRANAYKGHWSVETFRYLMVRLRNETDELAAAWRWSQKQRTVGTATFGTYLTAMTNEQRDAIIDECADIANFCAMIADIARRTK